MHKRLSRPMVIDRGRAVVYRLILNEIVQKERVTLGPPFVLFLYVLIKHFLQNLKH